MKRFFLAAAAVLFAGIVLTSSNPSLDGRALVADNGVFPKGYFAKTVGYLPGDSIKVTNPTNGERIDILVIGSLDPSEGVAILLSPEAAESLSIKKNSNNLVKLTKRNGTADEVASGSAIITKGAEEIPPAYEEIIEVPGAELADLDEEPIEFEPGQTLADIEGAKTVAQIVPEDIPEELAEEFVEEDDYPDSDPIELAEIPQEKVPEKIVAEDLVSEKAEPEKIVPEEIAPVVAQPSKVEEDEIPEESELAELDDFGEDTVEEKIADEIPSTEYAEKVDDELEEPEKELAMEATPVEDEYIEDELPAEEKVTEAPILDEYDAIVLVPSDANPPAATEKPLASVEETKKPVASKNSDVTYLNDSTDLVSRKYYVQIAVYSQNENVEQVSALYAKRYPLVVLDKGARKTVLVGPLGVDEYGIILERFKAYGFKDAFVKKAL